MIVVCGGCGVTGERLETSALRTAFPDGWGAVQITGLPVVNKQLCGGCLHTVRDVIDSLPAPRTTEEISDSTSTSIDS